MKVKEQIEKLKNEGYKGKQLLDKVKELEQLDDVFTFIEDTLSLVDDINGKQTMFRTILKTLVNSYLIIGLKFESPRDLLMRDVEGMLDDVLGSFGYKLTIEDKAHKAH